jgi:cell division transport system permease protein
MLDRIEFLLSEAFTALRRNGLMTFAAISTAAVALFLLGGLGYVYFRVSQFASNVSGKFEMSVYMKADLPRPRAFETADRIKQMAGVKSVTLIPKEEAWRKQQKELEISGAGLDNPLPDQLRIILSDLNRADQLASDIQDMPEVYSPNGVEYSKDVQKLMTDLLSIVRWLGGALGSLLLATAGILIYNAIRLTVIARRREIRIMQLVGASYSTVWTPFVIEGAIQGAAGGFIATFLLLGAQTALQNFVQKVSVDMIFPPYPLWPILTLLSSVGAVYGFVCSSFAVREPLRHGSGFGR